MDHVVCENQQDILPVCSDEEEDIKVNIGDRITSPTTDYEVQAILGFGAYGLVTQCRKVTTEETVALKIFVKKNAIGDSKEEEAILKTMKALNSDKFNVISLNDSFNFNGHYCLEFEKLDMNLREFLKMNEDMSLDLEGIRPILQQLATGLDFLKSANIIHADLKPENIMMVDHVQQPLKVKIIDFSLALQNPGESSGRTLQSLWYRAPEVLLGAPVSEAIDVWSLGCIAAELLKGYPLFPCATNYDLIRHIVRMIARLPVRLLKAGLFTKMYFTKNWKLKLKTPPTANFITPRTLVSLNDLVMLYADLPGADGCAVQCDCVSFVRLLTHMLMVDPSDRISPSEILQHPFLTMSHLDGTFDNSFYVKSSKELMMSICQDQRSDKGDNGALTTQQVSLSKDSWTSTPSLANVGSPAGTSCDRPSLLQTIFSRVREKSAEHEMQRKRQRVDQLQHYIQDGKFPTERTKTQGCRTHLCQGTSPQEAVAR